MIQSHSYEWYKEAWKFVELLSCIPVSGSSWQLKMISHYITTANTALQSDSLEHFLPSPNTDIVFWPLIFYRTCRFLTFLPRSSFYLEVCLTQSCTVKELNKYFLSAILRAVQRLFNLLIKVIGNFAGQELSSLVMQHRENDPQKD